MLNFLKKLLCPHNKCKTRYTGKRNGVFEERIVTCLRCKKEKKEWF